MTTQELCNELARELGWRYEPDADCILAPWWQYEDGKLVGTGQGDHPIPASLDALAAIWEEHLPHRRWGRGGGNWFSWITQVPNLATGIASEISVPDTGDFLHDFAALILASIRADKEKP